MQEHANRPDARSRATARLNRGSLCAIGCAAALLAGQRGAPADARRSEADRRRRFLAERRAEPRPAVAWAALAIGGWLTWVLGAFACATLALDEEDRLRPGPARAGAPWCRPVSIRPN